MSKDNNKGFQDRLKLFFKGLKTGANVPRSRSEEFITLTEDIENELSQQTPISIRLKAVKEINEIAKSRRLENFTTEKLWTLLEDLLKPEVAKETRHLIITFFASLCQSQTEKSGFLRAKFFHFMKTHNIAEDAGPKYELLKALTDNGRDVSYFDEKIGPLILQQTTGLIQTHVLHGTGENHGLRTGEFMIFLNNSIKFNQSFVDQEVLQGIIQNVCYIACATQDRQDTLECLHVLETVISYGSLPPSSLTTFLATLCRTVNVEFLCQTSWKTVRNLLGTHLGHSALVTLCQFMETVDQSLEYAVIRGAVFFAGVSVWGCKVVRSLKYSPSTILSSFAAALERKHIFISYEVVVRIHDLVKCSGDTLQSITWDLVLEIIETVVEDLQISEWKSDSVNYPKILKATNDTLDVTESLVDSGAFCGAVHRFYNVIETSSRYRSEASIEKLLMYKHTHYLLPTMPNWLNHLIIFCERHLKEENRRALKVKAIDIIHQVCMVQVQVYEDDLIEKIILHYFKGLDTETDLLVRRAGVQFIVEFLMESSSKKCHDILVILEKIVNRVYDNPSSNDIILRENDAVDISTAIDGLIRLFQKKIYQLPSSIAISCYEFLVRHLSYHYKKISILDHCGSIRYNIFDCFFKIRANSLYHLGFPTTASSLSSTQLVDINSPIFGPVKIRFSPYLAVDHRDGERPDTTKADLPNQVETTSHQSSSNQFHNSSTSNLISSSSSSTTSLASTITLANFQYPSGGLQSQQQSFQNLSPSIISNHSNPFNGLSSSSSGTSGVVVINSGPSHSTTPTPLLPVVTSISLTLACKLVVTCLKKEKDWKILELVLQQIPHVLENKALILSKHGNDIDYLATALCSMVTDKSPLFIDSLRGTPPKFHRSEFQAYIFPILTSLVSYHSHLESSVQLKIVKCLELGLVTKCSRICILALSICTLEMKDTMHKLLPEVLLSLSKITPKVNIAIPVLEFLSTLIHLPRIFASFVQDQYMSIFAIALPYTNPFKFNQYTVSLAHHVIAMWFLKCRLSFRRGFVSYIIKGLESNVWAPFEEQGKKANALESHNQDSSDRKRSSSLTEQTFGKRRERPISGHTGGPHQSQLHSTRFQPHILDLKPPMDKSLTIFHQELTETCVDLMARYAFADCSALPTRFQSTNFLLCGGNSQTWLTDNRIITITTSGCTQKELRDGLCDKCWLLCRKLMGIDIGEQGCGEESFQNHNLSSNSERHYLQNPLLENASLQRRRHHSAFAGTSPGKSSRPDTLNDCTTGSTDKAKDDFHLDNKISSDFDERGIFNRNYELSLRTKSDHSYCTCWCQGWAEVHIRQPTGNTSWMMRVQNQLGNHSTIDFPIKELSAMYMNTLFTSSLKSASPPVVQSNNSTTNNSSTQSSPTHPKQLPGTVMSASNQTTAVGNNDGLQQNSKSPPSPLSPHSPGTPTEEFPGEINGGRKNPVRRSNSSPEMCSSWKVPFMNHQREIEEQDEEEAQSNGGPSNEITEQSDITLQNVAASTSVSTATPTTAATQRISNSDVADVMDTKSKGSVSPFQCYDSIPEEIQSTSTSTSTAVVIKNESGVVEDLTPLTRIRMSTISVMSPARRSQPFRRMLSNESSLPKSSGGNPSGETGIRSGISPGFIFLQLCAQGAFGGTGTSKPLQLPLTEQNKKSLKVLDFIPPYETHKIGVVYVGPGEASNETKILQNQYGSSRYREFLNGLGKLIKLSQVDPQKTFLAGLSRDGVDGDFATIWQDDVMQVIFHVATLMPNRASDPSGNSKKCHIGNDFVAIVYNNSDAEYDISTIKGQFLYACVVIQPLDHKTNRVIVKAKPILADHIGHTEPKIVSDQNLPIMARQWALHSNLASVIFQSMQRPGADPYASNWLERLRHIKRLRARISQDAITVPHATSDESGDAPTAKRPFSVEDFTLFV